MACATVCGILYGSFRANEMNGGCPHSMPSTTEQSEVRERSLLGPEQWPYKGPVGMRAIIFSKIEQLVRRTHTVKSEIGVNQYLI